MNTVGFSVAFEETETNYLRRKERKAKEKEKSKTDFGIIVFKVAMEGLRINISPYYYSTTNQLRGAFLNCPAVPPSSQLRV